MFSRSYEICRVRGIPIRAHITLIVFVPLVAVSIASATGLNLLFGLLATLGFLCSIVLHELGHSVVAMGLGCRVQQILLLPIGGIAQLSHMPEEPKAEFRVAIAGPLVSLALAGIGLVLAPVVGTGIPLLGYLLGMLGTMNLWLALFNLLPSFPMDGGRIFRAWMTPRMGRLGATRLATRIGRGMALLFGFLGIVNLNIILVAIAIFIHQAAGAEYRAVRMQEAYRQTAYRPPIFGRGDAAPLDNDTVEVGPPPYAQENNRRETGNVGRAARNIFDDLFKSWK